MLCIIGMCFGLSLEACFIRTVRSKARAGACKYGRDEGERLYGGAMTLHWVEVGCAVRSW